jgi:hypothetical protein
MLQFYGIMYHFLCHDNPYIFLCIISVYMLTSEPSCFFVISKVGATNLGIVSCSLMFVYDPSILCDNSCLFNQLVYLILPINENRNVHSVYAHVLLT